MVRIDRGIGHLIKERLLLSEDKTLVKSTLKISGIGSLNIIIFDAYVVYKIYAHFSFGICMWIY